MQEYLDAFQKCYPAAKIEIKPAGKDKFWVVIDGNKGDRPLSFDDMKEATKSFNK